MNVGPGYMELINMAQANSISKERELQRRLNQNKEKKMNPKEVKLKVGVQKFLAKKEEEERRKREEAARKKQQLMELRNQDRKATSRVRRMINMTKSANKSVIADARECLSEACIEQASETQPDEDDYGYTSQYANEMYNKMLQKYQTDAKKEPSPWSKLEGPKIHQLKKSVPSSGKESSKSNSKHNQNNVENIAKIKETPKPQKKKAPPPPLGFDELLKLAEIKSKEPITIKKPVKESSDGPDFEFGRPMTAREKKTFLQEQALKQRAQAAFSGNQAAKASVTSIPRNSDTTVNHPKSTPIPKLTPTAVKVPEVSKSVKPQEPPTIKKTVKESFGEPESEFGRPMKVKEKPNPVPEQSIPQKTQATLSGNQGAKGFVSAPSSRTYESVNHSKSTSNPKPIPTANNKAYPPKLTRPTEPAPTRRPQNPHHRLDMPPPNHKRDKPQHKVRAIIESDEDYDSEMDDFIDDSDIPGEDISSMIGQMFGYNKRKYINEDSDDECMESSVEQQMREEARTLRLGVMEDLEDMKMEEEEKRRKAALLKKRKLK